MRSLILVGLLATACTDHKANHDGVACGAATCDVKSSQVCCWGNTFACTPGDQCSGEALPCDGPEDCSGGQCCLDLNNKFFCAASCDLSIGQVTICHSLRDCVGDYDICSSKHLITDSFTLEIGQCETLSCGDMTCPAPQCPSDRPCSL